MSAQTVLEARKVATVTTYTSMKGSFLTTNRSMLVVSPERRAHLEDLLLLTGRLNLEKSKTALAEGDVPLSRFHEGQALAYRRIWKRLRGIDVH